MANIIEAFTNPKKPKPGDLSAQLAATASGQAVPSGSGFSPLDPRSKDPYAGGFVGPATTNAPAGARTAQALSKPVSADVLAAQAAATAGTTPQQAAMAQAAPAQPLAAAPNFDRNQLNQFKAQGVDFDKIQENGVVPVPGQPGKFFNHSGNGWVAGPPKGATASAGNTPPTPAFANPAPGVLVISKDGQSWVPPDHAMAWKPTAGAPGDVVTGDPGPGATGANTVPGQANAAQTYSTTPGGKPLDHTTNQGTQDVVRNSYLQQATQGTQVDTNDPNFKQQLDPFVAEQERSRKQYEAEQAERMSAAGLGSSGAMQNERRLGAEKAGQASGAFKSQLVTRELENRRNEIKEALSGLRGMISEDQQRDLQKQLGQLDATIKRESLSQSGAISQAELALKDKLGTGALNMDMMRALLQNNQFAANLTQEQRQHLDRLGFDLSGRQADWDWKQRGN